VVIRELHDRGESRPREAGLVLLLLFDDEGIECIVGGGVAHEGWQAGGLGTSVGIEDDGFTGGGGLVGERCGALDGKGSGIGDGVLCDCAIVVGASGLIAGVFFWKIAIFCEMGLG